MRICIISDTHDNLAEVRKLVDKLNCLDCGMLIHCGDICGPGVLQELARLRCEVHCCFGNMDDKGQVSKAAAETRVRCHGEKGMLEVEGRKIGFVHLPNLAYKMAESGEFHVVFYGHTHLVNKEYIGKTLFVNPGEIQGRKWSPSFALYETVSGDVRIQRL